MKVTSFCCDEQNHEYSIGLANGKVLTGLWATRLIYLKQHAKNSALIEPHVDLDQIVAPSKYAKR